MAQEAKPLKYWVQIDEIGAEPQNVKLPSDSDVSDLVQAALTVLAFPGPTPKASQISCRVRKEGEAEVSEVSTMEELGAERKGCVFLMALKQGGTPSTPPATTSSLQQAGATSQPTTPSDEFGNGVAMEGGFVGGFNEDTSQGWFRLDLSGVTSKKVCSMKFAEIPGAVTADNKCLKVTGCVLAQPDKGGVDPKYKPGPSPVGSNLDLSVNEDESQFTFTFDSKAACEASKSGKSETLSTTWTGGKWKALRASGMGTCCQLIVSKMDAKRKDAKNTTSTTRGKRDRDE